MKLLGAFAAVSALVSALLAASFGPGREIARLPAILDEASGLANSRQNPDVLWVHNDSGDQPRVFAVNRRGKLLGTFLLGAAKNIDWEDMAIGPAPGGGSFLYLADIGDNDARRASVTIYRVLEPAVTPDQSAVTRTLSGVVAFEFVYEDGARDAESFMADPFTGDFYVVSKREVLGNRLYRAVAPDPARVNRFLKVATFPFVGATGADVSPDGLRVLIRRYSNGNRAATAATYWSRPDQATSLVDLLKQPGRVLPLAQELQGEAIAFSTGEPGFFTTTERGGGANAPLAPITFYPAVP